jgi:hypothetical protein
MNYFNELLESYDKLKKRKFKLIYLNEQGTIIPNASVEDAIKQAEALPTPVRGQTQSIANNPKPYSGDIGIYKSQKNVAGLATISQSPLDGRNPYIPVHKIISPEIKQKNLEICQRNDKIKNEWAKANNIPLLRIPYWDYDRIEELIEAFILQHTKKKEIKQLVLEM